MKTQKSALLGLALGLAAFGAGCKDTTTLEIPPEQPPPIVVTVSPQSLTLEVGGSAVLAASVTGGAATDAKTVTWSTSNAAIASVDGTGKVTAVAKGTATVTATSTADANAKSAASVTVTEPATPAAPSVSIKSITQFATTVPVALDNVFGQIDITLNLDVPAGAKISALRTYINSTKVCEQTFSGSAEFGATDETNSASEIICSVNTATYTGTPGTAAAATVTFPNGPGNKVKVEIVDPSGTITAQITSADMIFNNPSFIVAKMTAPTHCTTGATLGVPPAAFWCEGDITATFLPVMFSATTSIKSITLTETALTGTFRTDATASDGWSITLPKSSSSTNIGGVEGIAALTVASVNNADQNGPTCINPDPVLNPIGFCAVNTWPLGTGNLPAVQFLLDNKAPVITGGAISLPSGSNFWVGPNVTVSSLAAGLTVTENGVGGKTNLLQYRPVGTTSYTDAANGTSDIPESTTNGAYNIRMRICDDLNNCTSSSSATVGSDKTSPVSVAYAAGTPADGAILQTNAATVPLVVAIPTTWALTGGDALSGPYDTYGTLKRLNTSGTTTCVFGSGSSCSPVSNFGAPFTTTPSTDGYYTFEAVYRDLARNTTAPTPTSKMAISDGTLPAVQNIVLPGVLPNGGPATFSATVTDNLDLKDWAQNTVYAGFPVTNFTLPYSGPTAIDGFGPPLTKSANLSATVDFVRSLELAMGGSGTAGPPQGVVYGATAARFTVRDHALNVSTQSNTFAAGTVTPGASATTLGVTDFAFQVVPGAPTTICDQTAGACGTTAKTTTLQAVTRGLSGSFAAPFTRVSVYLWDSAAQVATFVGSTSARVSTDNGVAGDPVGRVWTYGPVTLSGDGLSGGQTANPGQVWVIGVGVSTNGDGLLNNVATFVTISN